MAGLWEREVVQSHVQAAHRTSYSTELYLVRTGASFVQEYEYCTAISYRTVQVLYTGSVQSTLVC